MLLLLLKLIIEINYCLIGLKKNKIIRFVWKFDENPYADH